MEGGGGGKGTTKSDVEKGIEELTPPGGPAEKRRKVLSFCHLCGGKKEGSSEGLEVFYLGHPRWGEEEHLLPGSSKEGVSSARAGFSANGERRGTKQEKKPSLRGRKDGG